MPAARAGCQTGNVPSPRTKRAYAFVSRWTVAAPREACWAVLADPELSWPRWWPGLAGRVLALTDDDARQGSRAALAFRTPLGYRLRLELVAAHVAPPSGVRFDVTGDLAGTGAVTLDGGGDGGGRTTVTILWDVRTTRRAMNLAGPALAPLFGWAHRRVMRAGERGLAGALAEAAGPSRSGGDVATAEPLEPENAQRRGDHDEPCRGRGVVRVDGEGAQVVEG